MQAQAKHFHSLHIQVALTPIPCAPTVQLRLPSSGVLYFLPLRRKRHRPDLHLHGMSTPAEMHGHFTATPLKVAHKDMVKGNPPSGQNFGHI